MKSIEEKAKRYDEAIKKAKEFKNNPFAGYDGTDLISALFSELTESEDERIRKALRERIIRYDPNNEILMKEEGISQRQFIAWIEKQGEPTEINPSEFDSQLNRLLKQFESLSKEELASSLSFYLNVVQNDGTYKSDEKQDEQKHVAKYKVGDTIYYSSFGRLVSFVIANIVEDGTDNPMYEDKDGNSVFEKDLVERKPTDLEETAKKYSSLYIVI